MALAVVLVSASAACGGAPVDNGTGVTSRPATEASVAGIEADVYLPTHTGTVPLVVMVPGRAWRTAVRAGLAPLAERLSAAGIVVVNATYHAADSGSHFPTELQDVVCAVDFAVARARAAGRRPDPAVVLGHSSGAHRAALAALGGPRFRGACPYPAATVDALVGLEGLYDVAAVPEVAEELFGVRRDADPDRWREGNALTWAGEVPSLPVFLGHGDRDELVPMSSTTSFAAALERAGHPVHIEIVTGAGHHDIYAPDVIAPALIRWIGPSRVADGADDTGLAAQRTTLESGRGRWCGGSSDVMATASRAEASR